MSTVLCLGSNTCIQERRKLSCAHALQRVSVISSNNVRPIYQVCMKCAQCNTIPLCVSFIKKNDPPLPPVLQKPQMKEASVCLLGTSSIQFQPFELTVCIPNTAKCSIKLLLTSHYRVRNFYHEHKGRPSCPLTTEAL